MYSWSVNQVQDVNGFYVNTNFFYQCANGLSSSPSCQSITLANVNIDEVDHVAIGGTKVFVTNSYTSDLSGHRDLHNCGTPSTSLTCVKIMQLSTAYGVKSIAADSQDNVYYSLGTSGTQIIKQCTSSSSYASCSDFVSSSSIVWFMAFNNYGALFYSIGTDIYLCSSSYYTTSTSGYTCTEKFR